MASAASPGPGPSGGREVPLWRLYLLRAGFLVLVVTGLFVHPQWILDPSPTDRGMILAFTGGLWLMGFIGLRYPLQMLPIAVFEFVWKMLWLLRFGIPQWLAGVRTPRLNEDMVNIGLIPLILAVIIPWGYVWRHYIKEPSESWR